MTKGLLPREKAIAFEDEVTSAEAEQIEGRHKETK